jgi:hypothetical protein
MGSESLHLRSLFAGIQLTLVAVFLANFSGDATTVTGVALLLVGSFLVLNGLLGDRSGVVSAD